MEAAGRHASARTILGLWLRVKLRCMLQAPQLALERERVNDGFGTTWQPQHALVQAPYIAKNLLFYDSSERAAVALTDAEKAQLVQARSLFPTWPSPIRHYRLALDCVQAAVSTVLHVMQ